MHWSSGDTVHSRAVLSFFPIYINSLVETEFSKFKKWKLLFATLDKGLNQGVIQIGPDKSHSITDIARRIIHLSGKNVDIRFDLSKPEGDKDRTADSSKAQEILRWQQKVSLGYGLQCTYDWARDYLKK